MISNIIFVLLVFPNTCDHFNSWKTPILVFSQKTYTDLHFAVKNDKRSNRVTTSSYRSSPQWKMFFSRDWCMHARLSCCTWITWQMWHILIDMATKVLSSFCLMFGDCLHVWTGNIRGLGFCNEGRIIPQKFNWNRTIGPWFKWHLGLLCESYTLFPGLPTLRPLPLSRTPHTSWLKAGI